MCVLLAGAALNFLPCPRVVSHSLSALHAPWAWAAHSSQTTALEEDHRLSGAPTKCQPCGSFHVPDVTAFRKQWCRPPWNRILEPVLPGGQHRAGMMVAEGPWWGSHVRGRAVVQS